MSDNENSAYEKLTPARKALVDAVMKNLEKGVGLWEQGWAGGGVPVSGISGKQYNGINRMFLMAATAERGYSDNRWVTFKQMEDKGWSFKRDEEGKRHSSRWKIRVGALSATKREKVAARMREYRLNTLNFVTGKQSSPLTDTLLTE